MCTNKLTGLSTPILEKLDLARFFDAVVGADSAPAPKPDPRHLIFAVEAAGGRIERAVMVGDASTDAGAARAAKAPLILVSFGYTEIPAADLAAEKKRSFIPSPDDQNCKVESLPRSPFKTVPQLGKTEGTNRNG